MALNKQQLAAVKDWQQEEVDMKEEWGDVILVRSMSIGSNDKLSQFKDEAFVYNMIMFCCCNADGSLFFDEPETDIEILKARSPESIIKLFHACEKVNKINLKEDDLAKNS